MIIDLTSKCYLFKFNTGVYDKEELIYMPHENGTCEVRWPDSKVMSASRSAIRNMIQSGRVVIICEVLLTVNGTLRLETKFNKISEVLI